MPATRSRPTIASAVDSPLTEHEQRLITDHIPLALHFARQPRYRNRGVSLADLEQAAMIGLLIAARKFKPDRGVIFASYAGDVVTSQIKREIQNQGRSIRMPVWLQTIRAAALHTSAALYLELERTPTIEEIACRIGRRADHVAAALAGDALSIYASHYPIGNGKESTLEDVIPDQAPQIDMAAIARSDNAALHDALETLGAQQRQAIELLYLPDPPLSYRAAAARMGVSFQRVHEIKGQALERLANLLAPIREES